MKILPDYLIEYMPYLEEAMEEVRMSVLDHAYDILKCLDIDELDTDTIRQKLDLYNIKIENMSESWLPNGRFYRIYPSIKHHRTRLNALKSVVQSGGQFEGVWSTDFKAKSEFNYKYIQLLRHYAVDSPADGYFYISGDTSMSTSGIVTDSAITALSSDILIDQAMPAGYTYLYVPWPEPHYPSNADCFYNVHSLLSDRLYYSTAWVIYDNETLINESNHESNKYYKISGPNKGKYGIDGQYDFISEDLINDKPYQSINVDGWIDHETLHIPYNPNNHGTNKYFFGAKYSGTGEEGSFLYTFNTEYKNDKQYSIEKPVSEQYNYNIGDNTPYRLPYFIDYHYMGTIEHNDPIYDDNDNMTNAGTWPIHEHGTYYDNDELIVQDPSTAVIYKLDDICSELANSNAIFSTDCYLDTVNKTTSYCLYTDSSKSYDLSLADGNYDEIINTEYTDLNHGYLVADYLKPLVDDTKFNVIFNSAYITNENKDALILLINNITGQSYDYNYILGHKEIVLKSNIDRSEMLSIKEQFSTYEDGIITIDQHVYNYDVLSSLTFRTKYNFSHITGRSSDSMIGYWSFKSIYELFSFNTGEPLYEWMEFTDNDSTVNIETIYDEITINEAPITSVLDRDKRYYYYLDYDHTVRTPNSLTEDDPTTQWENKTLVNDLVQNRLYYLEEPETPNTADGDPKAVFDPSVMYTMYRVSRNTDNTSVYNDNSTQEFASPGKSYIIGQPYTGNLYLNINSDTNLAGASSNYIVCKKSNVQRLWFSPTKSDVAITSMRTTMYNDVGNSMIYYYGYDDTDTHNTKAFNYTINGIYNSKGERLDLDLSAFNRHLECWLVNNVYNVRFCTKEAKEQITDAKFRYKLADDSKWSKNGESIWFDGGTVDSVSYSKLKTNISATSHNETTATINYQNLAIDGWTIADSTDKAKFAGAPAGGNWNDYVILKGSKTRTYSSNTINIASISIDRNFYSWDWPGDHSGDSIFIPAAPSGYTVHSQSSYITTNGSTSMYISIDVIDADRFNANNFRFLVAQSSEINFDYVEVYLDGSILVDARGKGYQKSNDDNDYQSGKDHGWLTVTLNNLTVGTHTVRITYKKDGSVDVSPDHGYLAFPTEYGLSDTGMSYSMTVTETVENDPTDSYTEFYINNLTSENLPVNGFYIASIDGRIGSPEDVAEVYLDDSITPFLTSTDSTWTSITNDSTDFNIPPGGHIIRVHYLKTSFNETYGNGFLAIPSSLVSDPSPFNSTTIPIGGHTEITVIDPSSTEAHIYANILLSSYTYTFKVQVTLGGTVSIYLNNVKYGSDIAYTDGLTTISIPLTKTSEWVDKHDIKIVYNISDITTNNSEYAEIIINDILVATSSASTEYEESVIRESGTGTIASESIFNAAYILYTATMTDGSVNSQNFTIYNSETNANTYIYSGGILFNRIRGGIAEYTYNSNI